MSDDSSDSESEICKSIRSRSQGSSSIHACPYPGNFSKLFYVIHIIVVLMTLCTYVAYSIVILSVEQQIIYYRLAKADLDSYSKYYESLSKISPGCRLSLLETHFKKIPYLLYTI